MSTVPEVIALCRWSTAEQVAEDRGGIQAQSRINRISETFHGVKIRREVIIVDVSGRHLANNPDFQRIIEEMKDPTLAGILVPEQSRMGRAGFDDWKVLSHFKKYRKLIYTPTGKIDLNTPEGRMAATMGSYMSGEELYNLQARFNRGKMIKRLEGKSPNGNQNLPRGFRFIRVRNEIGKVIGCHWDQDPIEMERLQRAVQMVIEDDLPFAAIVERIGGYSAGQNLKRILQNPILIGIRRYEWESTDEEYTYKRSKYANPKPRHRLVKRAEPLDVPTRAELEAGAAPIVKPIITLQTWDALQQRIREREGITRKTKLKNQNRPRFVAAGIAHCKCGEPLYTRYHSEGSKHGGASRQRANLDAYRCKTRHKGGPGCGAQQIHRIALDGAIEQLMSQRLPDPAFLEAVDEFTADNTKPNPVQAKVDQARANLADARKDFLDMVRRREITRAEFNAQIQQLESELRSLENLVPPPAPKIDRVKFLKSIARVFMGFHRLTFDAKRDILRGAVKRITVDTNAQTIESVTISGGFLGKMEARANGNLPSTRPIAIGPTEDLTIRFPEPYQIADSYVDGRQANGNHPNTLTQLSKRWRQ